MLALSRLVLRHRLLLAVFWLVAFAAGAATAGTTTERLAFDFSLPGQPGYEAEARLLAAYGNGGTNAPVLPVVTVPEGQTVAARAAEVGALFETVRGRFPQARVVDLASTGDGVFVTDDGRTTFALVLTPPPVGFVPGLETEFVPFLAELDAQSDLQIGVTGYNLLAQGGETEGPSVLVETLLGAVGALVVLAFVFASFLALVPLLVAAVSILSTFLVLLGLDLPHRRQLRRAVPGLADRAGGRHRLLAAGGDALAGGARGGPGQRRGRPRGDAHRGARRGGECPDRRDQPAGPGRHPGAVPALVRAGRPADPDDQHAGHADPAARAAQPHRPAGGLPADPPRGDRLAALDGLVAAGRAAPLAGGRPRGAGAGGAVRAARRPPDRGVAFGVPRRRRTGVRRAAGAPRGRRALRRPHAAGGPGAGADAGARQVADRVRGVDGVAAAFAPVDTVVGSAVASVLPVTETVDTSQAQVVDRVRAQAQDVPGFAGIAGQGALVLDYLDAVDRPFPYVLALIARVTYVLLVRAFRSLLLPLEAVLLNVLSVAATFGAVVLFWQQGHGSEQVFGIEGTGAITFFLPILILAFLFGLSMDYEVFILARMREEYDSTGNMPQAIVVGLGRTGRLVTSAALILFLSFLSFLALASAPLTDIKVLGTALGFGILLDATVVRALLVPALVSLFGRYDWWLPAVVARVLRVDPSPLREDLPLVEEPGRRAGVVSGARAS